MWQVRELEGELDAEQRRHAEAQKTIRRHERRIQELTQISEDEEKARDVERDTIEKLQSKLKQYKRELDDAVSINLCEILAQSRVTLISTSFAKSQTLIGTQPAYGQWRS